MVSPYFLNLFSGDFAENAMPEIPIEDVNPYEFMELLELLYPRDKPITGIF